MWKICLHEVVPRGVLFLLLEEERLDRLLLVELLGVVPLLHRHHRLSRKRETFYTTCRVPQFVICMTLHAPEINTILKANSEPSIKRKRSADIINVHHIGTSLVHLKKDETGSNTCLV